MSASVLVASAVWRQFEAEHVQCLLDLQRTALARGVRLGNLMSQGDALISRSRSRLATRFLETDYDVLLTLDSDIVFSPDEVLRLCERATEHGVIGAMYVTRGGAVPKPVSWLPVGVEVPFHEGAQPVKVRFLSNGCMAVHRRVFEKLRGSMPLCERDSVSPFYPFYQPMVAKVGGQQRYLSEDWAFPLELDTLILADDWRWKPLSSYDVGDRLIAVDEVSPPYSSRRLQVAEVTGVIHRTLPLWKIVTEDGEFVTTAEHPWLALRGWRRPVGHPPGPARDASLNLPPPAKWCWTRTDALRPGDSLAGIVPAERNPNTDAQDYQAGYVQGIFHSDGCLSRDNRRGTLRMKDQEAIDRAMLFANSIGVRATRGPDRRPANPRHSTLHSLAVCERSAAERLGQIMDYDAMPSRDFAAGYLAGMYDGDGSRDGATISIHNTSHVLTHRVVHAGHMLGLDFVLYPRRARLVGAEARYRFWQLTTPAIQRKVTPVGQMGNDGIVRNVEARHRRVKVLAVEEMGRIGDVACLTTTTGTFIAGGIASHNCQRARDAGFPAYLDPSVRLGHLAVRMLTLEDMFRPARPEPSAMVLRQDADGEITAGLIPAGPIPPE